MELDENWKLAQAVLIGGNLAFYLINSSEPILIPRSRLARTRPAPAALLTVG